MSNDTRRVPPHFEPTAETVAVGTHDGPRPRVWAPPIEDLPTGGRYEALSEIGRGGTGRVHRVLDRDLLRHVAMKVALHDLGEDPAKLRAFLKEAQVTGQLDHPNIPPVHEMSGAGGPPQFFTMKLVTGETLAEYAERFPVEEMSRRLRELLPIFLKVCDAVAFAHSRGVVHRDIKPENVMVGRFGQVYLMDWGLSRLLGRSAPDVEPVAVSPDIARAAEQERKQIAGTPAYMAPEQAQARVADVDERTDVFCLGSTLYFILTGQPPYCGSGLRESVRRATLGLYTPFEKAAPNAPLPPSLCSIVERALAFEPAARHQSALELKSEVEQFLRGGLHLPIRSFAPGERILTEGEQGEAAFIILRGRCRVFHERGGGRTVLRDMGPGDVFGEMGMLTGEPRTASVEALEAVTATVVTRALLAEAFGAESWATNLLVSLARRFRDLEDELRRPVRREGGDPAGP